MAIKNSDRYSSLEQPCGKLVGYRNANRYKQYGLVMLFTSYAVLEACYEKMNDLRKDMMHELLTNSIRLV